MAQSSPIGPTSVAAQPAGVTLSCRPDRSGNKLIFPYIVANHGTADIYVMDATTAADPNTRKAVADRNAVVIWLGADGFAHVLKGIAPMPVNRLMLAQVVPLAAKLPPGQTFDRALEVQLPLAETGPYHSDLPLREYQLTDIQGVMLTVEFLRSTVEGFAAEPIEYAPDLFNVRGKHTVGQTERVSCAFPSRQLQILKRPDDFRRPEQ